MAVNTSVADEVQALLTAAVAAHERGELTSAEALYRQTLALDPNQADALHLLGAIEHQNGRHDSAIALIGRAIALNPSAWAYHFNLGLMFQSLDRLEEAAAALAAASALAPENAGLHARLADVLKDLKRREPAIEHYHASLALEPADPAARIQVAALLLERPPEEPRMADTTRVWEDEALSHLREAARIAPDEPAIYNLRGGVMLSRGQLEQASRDFEQAIRLKPDFAPARYNLGLALLALGKLRQGWPEYEWRGASELFERRRGLLAQPLWDGGPLAGRRILIHAEQGLGDAVQFARYVPLVASRGGRVILECLPPLRRLFERLPGVERLVMVDEPLPPFDVRIPMLSLARCFDTTLDTIPAGTPYLEIDKQAIGVWRQRLASASGLKVGLVWEGNPDHVNNANRSLRLSRLAPLASLRNVHLYSLQKGVAAGQVQAPPPGMALTDLGPELADMADTAAALMALDVVITIDTSVAHLAGALGRPVWVLLAFAPDWRWLAGRPDSPWYPTARLFRQTAPGEWDSVIDEVAGALEQLARGYSG